MSLCCQKNPKIYFLSFALNLFLVFRGHLFSLSIIKAGRVCHSVFFSPLCASQHMCRNASSRCATEDTFSVRTPLWGNLCLYMCVYVCVCVRCWYLVALPSPAVNTSLSWFLVKGYLQTGRDSVGRWSCPPGDLSASAQWGELLRTTHMLARWNLKKFLIATSSIGLTATWFTHRGYYRICPDSSLWAGKQ